MKVISHAIESQARRVRANSWVASLGASIQEDGCLFRVWAGPNAKIELVLDGEPSRCTPMLPDACGVHQVRVEGVGSGARYWFRINGTGPYPDPASRFQPLGVHGPSQVIDHNCFAWKSTEFQSPSLRELVFYELHVGTFTPAGTFLAVIDKLDGLQQLGINAIELMPIADFAGEHNWGYDGVFPYAPAHSYGTPDDLRKLVEEAHQRGIAVCLDVVYNHLGPDGAYQSVFAPGFYSSKHKTPWGDGLNFDGDGGDKVRAYFIESALAWIYDYRVDGLRVDATHAIQDDSDPPFLTDLTKRVHAAAHSLGRTIFIIAEDERNERRLVLPSEQGGHGFDAVWSDDFHHHMRHRLAGDSDGYYRDFDGTTESIARTIRDGWFFNGQFARHSGHRRGTKPDGLSYESRVFCIQNHDQIGNRAFGERLSSQISYPAYLAASALLLFAPEIPLLFMGQEWAASEPFLYFTDHNKELGRMVTEGRRKEFEHFSAFADETRRGTIPDPQRKETFRLSKLDWTARQRPLHAACLNWYRDLLHVRRYLLSSFKFRLCQALNAKMIHSQWESAFGRVSAIVALEGPAAAQDEAWTDMALCFSSEDTTYTSDACPVIWQSNAGKLTMERAGAVIFASEDFAPISGKIFT
ncbi:MAG TPA: malto-oligosyltrehalose trehalohydrolase [Acidobacteriaceae bacterium]|nr:malto-oligosyltrehalose trehalohydrolase [Acidobacteriaceae bacterium]